MTSAENWYAAHIKELLADDKTAIFGENNKNC